ncbi:MAG: hypothetical protein CL417_04500 [Acidimicrobiaceae bacterium]|nr:hypothetical protein [Acidimicrobiaceae bacterium]
MVETYRLLIIARLIAIFTLLVVILSSCGSSSAPQIPVGPNGESDTELSTGRGVWTKHCASCHGSSGQGGRGQKLNDGEIFKIYPEVDGLLNVISVGKGQGMPAFGSKLSNEEIAAVSRYIREILN